MRRAYIRDVLNPSSRATVRQANEIINDPNYAGIGLTLRQLYYQFVSRGYIRNKQTEYDRLGRIISDARLMGLIDWYAIVDRTRYAALHSITGDPEATMDAIGESWTIDKWSNQPNRVEVWIEKDALTGVLDRVCPELDVTYFACKGYVSQSEMYGAAQRHLRYERNGQGVRLLHLGDHDPSGLDMTRDIEDRLRLFGTSTVVDRIALTMDQIEELNPPPNPAKLTDSRAREYVETYGYDSWELDALDPPDMIELVRDNVLQYRDEDLWELALEEEREQGRIFRQIAARWDDVADFVSDEEVS